MEHLGILIDIIIGGKKIRRKFIDITTGKEKYDENLGTVLFFLKFNRGY
jgi:hypothetical protein